MISRQSIPISDHTHCDNVRKKVCKACDRCRLKKSKCDGASPCSRCRGDNVICTFGERKSAHDKVYPKGYVEMLEQQQAWLVHGLQELYHRTTEGEGWPGDHLKPEPNGQPLTHDLLARLGALDHSKSEYFEENPEIMQKLLWRNDMHRQESSNGSSESAHSVAARPSFSSDAFLQTETMLPLPPTYSPSSWARVKSDPMVISKNPPFDMPMPDVVNPLALQDKPPQQWNNRHNFRPFDEMDLMSTANYTNLSFDELNLLPMFNRQMSTNCISPKDFDYEDFTQFLNPDATITSN